MRKKTPQRYGETQSYTKNSVFLRASPYLCVNFWRILNFILVLYTFFSKAGKTFIEQIDLRLYTYLNVVRVPVEFTILWLFMYNLMPQTMTFEGRNFDILSGITAPFMGYFAWRTGKPNRPMLLVWNTICLLLVLQIVGTGILSAPTPFQQLSFEQPNKAVLYFPFVWLPSIIVPIVLFGHFVAFYRLRKI